MGGRQEGRGVIVDGYWRKLQQFHAPMEDFLGFSSEGAVEAELELDFENREPIM
jgi:hypothetical protein